MIVENPKEDQRTSDREHDDREKAPRTSSGVRPRQILPPRAEPR